MTSLLSCSRPPVALVTGAARGIGKAAALALGARGWTVYVTDRYTDQDPHPGLPGTVDQTAREVGAAGGRGIGRHIDHRYDDQSMPAVLEEIAAAHGGLDLLVSNATAGNDLPFRPAPFWELSTEHWATMFQVGVRSHIAVATYAAPLLQQRAGLLLLTGYADGTDTVYGHHLYYDLAMRCVSRLAQSMAADLGPRGVQAITVVPGFTATEAILAGMGGSRPPGSDSPALVGAAVAELVTDPERGALAGTTVTVRDLARRYDLRDPQPAPGG